MYKITPQFRLKVARYYLTNAVTLLYTAKKFAVHYQSVYKWASLYKQGGEAAILMTYRRPWNRFPQSMEERILLLKERDPAITVRKAQEILSREGISVSIKGIWGVWKRYGYAGYDKKKMINDFTFYIPWSSEAKKMFNAAKQLHDLGNTRNAAHVLNTIPFIPRNELILEIPDKYLNQRRRIEKLALQFGDVSLPTYIKSISQLYEKLRKQHLRYSALRVGIISVIALAWSGQPDKQLKRICQLRKIISKHKSCCSYLLFEPRFTLLIQEGIAQTFLSRIKNAQNLARACRRLLKHRKHAPYYLMTDLGYLYINLEDYREAEYWILRSMEGVSPGFRKMLKGVIAKLYFSSGQIKKASRFLKSAQFEEWIPNSAMRHYFESALSMMRGEFRNTISLARSSLMHAKKEELTQRLFNTTLMIASAYCGLGERTTAVKLLRPILRILQKRKLKKDIEILKTILDDNYRTWSKDTFPTVRLINLLKANKYKSAHSLALKKNIFLHLCRNASFFPDSVKKMLEEREKTGLPRAIIKLPVFNKTAPVYKVNFLGTLTVFKNQKKLRVKLTPKDSAFLIHLALQASEPEKEIPLHRIYGNFWKKSEHPAANLSHMLVRIRNALSIPSHLLRIEQRADNPAITNAGIYFVTDYDEFQESIVQAKALVRADEWGAAQASYAFAFSRFEGEPFWKMYDDWSDDKRLEILFSYESELLSYADGLVNRGEHGKARELLLKASSIIADSDDIEQRLLKIAQCS